MVPTDDGRHIPATFREFMEVFIKAKAATLPPPRITDHAIDLASSYNVPYGRIYNLSEFQLRTLLDYIQANLANGFIQRSSSPAAALVLFANNKNAVLRICVDYLEFNLATVKNGYPLPLLSEMLDHVWEPRIFRNLDLRSANNSIPMKDSDEYKTAC